MERPLLTLPSDLPPPIPADEDGPEIRLASAFQQLPSDTQTTSDSKAWTRALKGLNRYFGYYASQLALWGSILPLFYFAWQIKRQRRKSQHSEALRPKSASLDPRVKPLLQAATAVPLIVFGILSVFSKVEANWSAMYLFSASALLAPALSKNLRGLLLAWGLNALLVAIAIAHAHWGFLPIRAQSDRLLLETHGYQELAHHLKTLQGPVFTDTYQTAAMGRFWEPSLKIRQWPGLTRMSEFLRNPQLMDIKKSDLSDLKTFWLLQSNVIPPKLPDFLPIDHQKISDCVSSSLEILDFDTAKDVKQRCLTPVHEWYLTRYITKPREP